MAYEFDFGSVLASWPMLLQGAWTTLVLTFWATLAGFTVGTLCAVARTSGPRWLRLVVGGYVEVVRNTPLLIQAYFLIFGLASIGARLPIMLGVVIAMVVNIGSYTTEVMRAGIESIKRGQIEAAGCLGLSKAQIFLHVVLRPAMERVYPSLVSLYVLLMLGSSVLSAVGVEELFGVSNRVQSLTYRNFEVFIVLGAIYLALTLLLRGSFWVLGQLIFPRRRKLGTAL
ncbi:amino acid ABC transporter permease [Bosea sp. 685]|uniref:amino acid ABC transporter permease n=1 Tax=Bosea sp. 685 TaxID=3080057 RepID=UPI002892DDA5|nr:amino acid ABC transporter permease [Bosea sp. 685]WNJ88033.1 amino acid ABC transporter permease [Bosea sp. 685]